MNDYDFLILNMVKTQTSQLRIISNYRSFISLIISNQIKKSEITEDQMRNLQLEILQDQQQTISTTHKTCRQLKYINEDTYFNQQLQELFEENFALQNDKADKSILSQQILELQIKIPPQSDVVSILCDSISQSDIQNYKNKMISQQTQNQQLVEENKLFQSQINQLQEKLVQNIKDQCQNDQFQIQIQEYQESLLRFKVQDENKDNTIKMLNNTIQQQNQQLNNNLKLNSIDIDIVAMFLSQLSTLLNDKNIHSDDEELTRELFVKSGKRVIKHIIRSQNVNNDIKQSLVEKQEEIDQLKQTLILLQQQQIQDTNNTDTKQIEELNLIIEDISQQNDDLQQKLQTIQMKPHTDDNNLKNALKQLKNDVLSIYESLKVAVIDGQEFVFDAIIAKSNWLIQQNEELQSVKQIITKLIPHQKEQLDEINIIKKLVGCE